MDWFQVLGTRRTGGEPGSGLGNVAERQTWFAAPGAVPHRPRRRASRKGGRAVCVRSAQACYRLRRVGGVGGGDKHAASCPCVRHGWLLLHPGECGCRLHLRHPHGRHRGVLGAE